MSPGFEPGIYPGLPRSHYAMIDAVNYSTIKHCRRSAAHARHRQQNPPDQTPAQALGELVHCYLLEPARFAAEYVELPDLTRNLKTRTGESPKNPTATAEYKQRLAEFGQAHMGRQFVRPEEMAVLRGIGESIAACRVASAVMQAHTKELAAVWQDPDTGLRCKALIDLRDGVFVADLKTADDASPGGFARLVAQHAWHVQAAFYLWGLSILGKPAGQFYHVAVETAPPFGVAVYELDDAAIDQGIREFRSHLDTWNECLQCGRWPAYADRVEPLSLPRYALTREDQ